MQFLSQSAQYAVSAIIVLAREPMGKAISAADLAAPLHCPAAYLSQTLSKLIDPGILESRRGLNGGVYLVREPKNISLYEVVEAIDGTEFYERCFLGINGCGSIEPCPFHEFWAQEREAIREWLSKTTFEDAKNGMTDVWFEQRLRFNRRAPVF